MNSRMTAYMQCGLMPHIHSTNSTECKLNREYHVIPHIQSEQRDVYFGVIKKNIYK